MAQQCAIYLDPYDKANLEGTAMLIGRMPDITDRIYRGVTCQRWFVRFLPDQAIVFRWLDYGDAEPYVYPIADSNLYTFSLARLIRNDASPFWDWPQVGNVLARWRATKHFAAYILPRAGRLAGIDISYIVNAATGGAALTYISARKNDAATMNLSLADSTTVGGPYSRSWQTEAIYAYAQGDRLTLGFYQAQPAGEEVELTYILATLHIAWGDFT